MIKENFNQFVQTTSDGKVIDPSYVRFRGMKSIVINTASKCGYTDSDMKDIAKFAELMKDKVSIYLYPSDDFNQEPNTDEENEVCCDGYGLVDLYPTVKIMSKSSVISKENELYQWLQNGQTHYIVDNQIDGNPFELKWNFHKYLINTDGTMWGTLFPGESLISEDIEEWCNIQEIQA